MNKEFEAPVVEMSPEEVEIVETDYTLNPDGSVEEIESSPSC